MVHENSAPPDEPTLRALFDTVVPADEWEVIAKLVLDRKYAAPRPLAAPRTAPGGGSSHPA